MFSPLVFINNVSYFVCEDDIGILGGGRLVQLGSLQLGLIIPSHNPLFQEHKVVLDMVFA